jgi:signal transduction histidine kinase
MSLELSPQATARLLQGQRAILAQLAQGASLNETLSSIAYYAESCTPDMQASILWYEASTGKLRRGGHSRLPESFASVVDGLMPGPVAGSCGTAAFQRSRVVSVDVQQDPLWEAFREFAAAHDIRSAWSTPLLSPNDGTLLGVFGMYYPDPREPSAEDLEYVDHFTHLAAIAIERSLRDEALRQSEARRHQGLLALTAGMAHELNTPLGVARTASQLVLEQVAGNPEHASLTPTVSLVEDNIERAVDLLRSFHTSVLDQGEQDVTTIDVVELVESAVRSLRPVLDSAHVTVDLSGDGGQRPRVLGAPVRLNQVIVNLLSNAATHAYGPEGGVVNITVGKSLLHDGKTAIVVSDRGRGMSDEEAARCTDAFYTTRRGRSGGGLGLFLARHVTEAELGGSLLLETRPGDGVRWTVLLPMLQGATV